MAKNNEGEEESDLHTHKRGSIDLQCVTAWLFFIFAIFC